MNRWCVAVLVRSLTEDVGRFRHVCLAVCSPTRLQRPPPDLAKVQHATRSRTPIHHQGAIETSSQFTTLADSLASSFMVVARTLLRSQLPKGYAWQSDCAIPIGGTGYWIQLHPLTPPLPQTTWKMTLFSPPKLCSIRKPSGQTVIYA